MAMEHQHFSIRDTSSNGVFSIDLLVFGGVLLCENRLPDTLEGSSFPPQILKKNEEDDYMDTYTTYIMYICLSQDFSESVFCAGFLGSKYLPKRYLEH